MELIITEDQLKKLSASLREDEDPVAATAAAEAQPETGASDEQKGTQGYPEVTTWASLNKITRGPANQIANTKWSETVGSTLNRDVANQLKEQQKMEAPYQRPSVNPKIPVDKWSTSPSLTPPKSQLPPDIAKLAYQPINGTKTIYIKKEDDGDSLLVNLLKGEFSEALLDYRKVMFTTGGMVVQAAVEGAAGSTIIVPVVIESLMAAVLLNDLALYESQGYRKEDQERVLMDIVFYLFRGALGAGVKGLKSPQGIKLLTSAGKNIQALIAKISRAIPNLPIGLKNWVSKQMSRLNNLGKYINDFITSSTVKTVTNIGAKIPIQFRKGIISGLLAFVSIKGLDKLLGVENGRTQTELSSNAISDEYTSKVIETFGINEMIDSALKAEKVFANLKAQNNLGEYAKKLAIETFAIPYPCLANFYKSNQFKVTLIGSDNKIVCRIGPNNDEYVSDENGELIRTSDDSYFTCG